VQLPVDDKVQRQPGCGEVGGPYGCRQVKEPDRRSGPSEHDRASASPHKPAPLIRHGTRPVASRS